VIRQAKRRSAAATGARAAWRETPSALDPSSEAAWLTLAATSEPAPALAYAARALEINPASQPARRAIRWAVGRLPPREGPKTPHEIRPSPGKQAVLSPAHTAVPPRRPLGAPAGAVGASPGWIVIRDPVFLVAES
jgi:hypothetical protein